MLTDRACKQTDMLSHLIYFLFAKEGHLKNVTITVVVSAFLLLVFLILRGDLTIVVIAE